MYYNYDKDLIKQSLTIEQIVELLEDFGGDPIIKDSNTVVSRTICHNERGEGSHKLYFYKNTDLFCCYTACGSTFDIFELVQKIFNRERPKENDWSLPECVHYVASKFGFAPTTETGNFEESYIINDLKLLQKYDKIKDINIEKKEVVLKEYDGYFLKNLPRPHIESWEKEGITYEVAINAGICYDPLNIGIVIPHYDINNRLVGVRERTLVQEQAELYGKYMPALIGGIRYTHPLSLNLYNLNNSKDNIKKLRKAFIFESEKSCLLYRSYFGEENDLSVACCGSSIGDFQIQLLLDCGVEEIIIALDRQYIELGDAEHQKLVKNLKKIHNKYGNKVNISYLFDLDGLLPYKASPIDVNKETF
jgi:hypothetical protein